ncbi:hypothetical protein [Nostoc sp. ChiQUE01b]|uniref:hypothetical protein n=1 Tax=Nostoc sp. ChiQUE01b TaxID=3075376 RepID=UPI002AD4F6CC|nr:hypothetical protein [Nostoc sp. ChiQUE01b]
MKSAVEVFEIRKKLVYLDSWFYGILAEARETKRLSLVMVMQKAMSTTGCAYAQKLANCVLSFKASL